MLRKITNKKAQVEFGPIVLVAVVIALLLMAPIMMRIIGTVTGTFFTQMNTTAPEAVAQASPAVDKVYNFFDYLIVIIMFINVIILFISAWFIDTNPIFIILYIIFAFVLVLFLPNMLTAVDRVWEKTDDMASLDTWEGNSLNLTFTDWIRRNMIMVIVMIIAMTGIITYAKFKITQGQF
jgi:hypothetical protein